MPAELATFPALVAFIREARRQNIGARDGHRLYRLVEPGTDWNLFAAAWEGVVAAATQDWRERVAQIRRTHRLPVGGVDRAAGEG